MSDYRALSPVPDDRPHASSEHFDSSSGSGPILTPDTDFEDDAYLHSAAEDADLEKSFRLNDLRKDPEVGRTMSTPGGPSQTHDGYEEGDEKQELYERRRRTSDSTVHSFMLYTPDEERAVVKKFDRRLVLFMAFLYMLSFLDRSSSPSHVHHTM